jgi:hypothetical protein
MFSKEASNSVIDLLFHGNGINVEFIKDTGINFTNETDNIVITTLSSPLDLYVNRLKADDKVYFVGNNSLLKTNSEILE